MTRTPPPPVTILGHRVNLKRTTSATISLMSVLVVYHGWAQLESFAEAAAVIIAPILALTAAHLFAELMQAYSEQQTPLTGAQWRSHLARQGPLLLAAVPPLIVLTVGWLSPLTVGRTIEVLLWTAIISLMLLAGMAGRQAGLRGWRWLLATLSGGAIGVIVISLQVLLKPN